MTQRWVFTTLTNKINRFLILNYLIKTLLNYWVLSFLVRKALLDIITWIPFSNHSTYSTSIYWAPIPDQWAPCYPVATRQPGSPPLRNIRSSLWGNRLGDIGKLLKWIFVKNDLFFQCRHPPRYKGFPRPECSGSWTRIHQSSQLFNG